MMHYDIHEDAERVERNYTAGKNGFADVAFVLSLVMLIPVILTAVLG